MSDTLYGLSYEDGSGEILAPFATIEEARAVYNPECGNARIINVRPVVDPAAANFRWDGNPSVEALTPELPPGPYPLKVIHERAEFVIVTNQGNHYASTHNPAAARHIVAGPDVSKVLSRAEFLMRRAAEGDNQAFENLLDCAKEAHAAIKRWEKGTA